MTVVPINAARAKRKCDDAGYRERMRVQTLQWASGNIYHNRDDDECCPDFSCCFPKMFEAGRAPADPRPMPASASADAEGATKRNETQCNAAKQDTK